MRQPSTVTAGLQYRAPAPHLGHENRAKLLDIAWMAARRLSNVVGFDDAPFQRGARAPVTLVGAVCAATRLDIVLRAELQQDGDDATQVLAQVTRQPELSHVRAVLLKGITMAGFNVVDIHALSEAASLPVLVVLRRPPRFEKFYQALAHLPDHTARRKLVEKAGPLERCGALWVQRAGLSVEEAHELLTRTTLHGTLPEPLRLAHLIASGVTLGISRGHA